MRDSFKKIGKKTQRGAKHVKFAALAKWQNRHTSHSNTNIPNYLVSLTNSVKPSDTHCYCLNTLDKQEKEQEKDKEKQLCLRKLSLCLCHDLREKMQSSAATTC